MEQAATKATQIKTASTGDSWRGFADGVTAILAESTGNEAAKARQIQNAMDQLFNELANTPAFLQQLSDCPVQLASGKPTWTNVLFESDAIKGGLLGVYKDKPIPLHDHPGCGAVVLVLSGSVNIQYANTISNKGGLAELEIARAQDCQPGQVDWFTADERNIHRVEALTDKAILLVAHLPHIEPDRQQLYFPCNEYEPAAGSRFLAHRVPLVHGDRNIHSVN